MHVRDIRVYIDRKNFIIGPTNCARKSIINVITGAGVDFTNPADQVPVSVGSVPGSRLLESRVQTALCGEHFGQDESRQRRESRRHCRIAARSGTQANIARVKVELPRQLPSRVSTLQKACPAKIFEVNPARCPSGSVVGTARATTPVVPEPLVGPAYFVSHGGEQFPSLIMVIQGYGIKVELVGTTFILKAGVTSSTFETVPDVPVGAFQLSLPEGQNSA